MEPIISPWLVWLLAILPNLYHTLTTTIALCMTGAGIAVLTWFLKDCDEGLQISSKLTKRIIVACLVFSALALSVRTVIPDREWAVAIVASRHVTPDNLEKGYTGIVDAKNTLKQDFLDILEMLSKDTASPPATP